MIGALLAVNAARYPDSAAISFGARTFTYAVTQRADVSLSKCNVSRWHQTRRSCC